MCSFWGCPYRILYFPFLRLRYSSTRITTARLTTRIPITTPAAIPANSPVLLPACDPVSATVLGMKICTRFVVDGGWTATPNFLTDKFLTYALWYHSRPLATVLAVAHGSSR